MKLLSELFVNLCILGMLLKTFNLLTRKRIGFISPAANIYRRLQYGVIMGIIGVILMLYTIPFNGTILDLRQLPVALAALYGGMLTPIFASIVIVIGRISIFGLNNASIHASILILLISITCGFVTKVYHGLVKQWTIMNVINLLLTSFVFSQLVKNKVVLLNIYLGYWTISLVGAFIIFCLMEYMRQSKEAFQAYQKNASTDFLTGLNNVRKFDEILKDCLEQADRHHEKVSFIFMDIDHFKQINDRYGHSSGDEVLKQISQVLRYSCRSVDIVSRNGGEEFSIILPSCSIDQAAEVAERIRTMVERHNFRLPNDTILTITVSLGLSTYHETTDNLEELIKQADQCLYKAKSTGRNRVVQAI